MNPSDTPNLFKAHEAVIAQIDNEALSNKETVGHIKSLEGAADFNGPLVPLNCDVNFNKRVGNDYLLTNTSTNNTGENVYVYGRTTNSVLTVPLEPYEVHESEMTGEPISSNIIVTSLGNANVMPSDIHDVQASLKMLLLRMGNGNPVPGSSEVLGVSVQFGVVRDSKSDRLTFYRFSDETVNPASIVIEQVVRRDPTEPEGEVVDGRREKPGQSYRKQTFKQLDSSNPDELAVINELRLELKKAAEAIESKK